MWKELLMCEMHVMVLESPLLIFCPLQSAPIYCKKMEKQIALYMQLVLTEASPFSKHKESLYDFNFGSMSVNSVKTSKSVPLQGYISHMQHLIAVISN